MRINSHDFAVDHPLIRHHRPPSGYDGSVDDYLTNPAGHLTFIGRFRQDQAPKPDRWITPAGRWIIDGLRMATFREDLSADYQSIRSRQIPGLSYPWITLGIATELQQNYPKLQFARPITH
jgi:hypothetical protein